MPTPYPKEFRADVVAVARPGRQVPGPGRAQFRDLGVLSGPLAADRRPRRSAHAPPASSRSVVWRPRTVSCADAPSSSSRRTRSCAGPPPTSPATPSQNDVPAGPRPCRRQHPCRGDLPGARLLQASVLPVARSPGHPAGLGRCAPDQRRDRRSITTTPSSATGSSPTSSPTEASPRAGTGSTGSAPSNGCGRSTRRNAG